MDFATTDTGIFNACKINNLLILLAQAVHGTVSRNQVYSIACVSLIRTAEFRQCTVSAAGICHQKFLSAGAEDPALKARDA
jgi:hypothetical protein